MKDCCQHLINEARKELKRKDERIAFLESECTRLFDPVREFWNMERREEVRALAEALLFYAENHNWDIPEIDPVTGFTGMSSKSNVERDHGELARSVLQSLPSQASVLGGTYSKQSHTNIRD